MISRPRPSRSIKQPDPEGRSKKIEHPAFSESRIHRDEEIPYSCCRSYHHGCICLDHLCRRRLWGLPRQRRKSQRQGEGRRGRAKLKSPANYPEKRLPTGAVFLLGTTTRAAFDRAAKYPKAACFGGASCGAEKTASPFAIAGVDQCGGFATESGHRARSKIVCASVDHGGSLTL